MKYLTLEDLRKEFEETCFSKERANARNWDQEKMIDELLKAVKIFFKSTGKQGGTTTHTRHPEHLKTISKNGVEARKQKRLNK